MQWQSNGGNMQYKYQSNFYIPRTKGEILKLVMPHWKGKKQELKDMEFVQIKAIFIRMRQEQLNEIMKKI